VLHSTTPASTPGAKPVPVTVTCWPRSKPVERSSDIDGAAAQAESDIGPTTATRAVTKPHITTGRKLQVRRAS